MPWIINAIGAGFVGFALGGCGDIALTYVQDSYQFVSEHVESRHTCLLTCDADRSSVMLCWVWSSYAMQSAQAWYLQCHRGWQIWVLRHVCRVCSTRRRYCLDTSASIGLGTPMADCAGAWVSEICSTAILRTSESEVA